MCMYIDISNCSIYPISPFYFDLIFERSTPTVTTPMSCGTDTCKFLHFAFYNELAETKYISLRIHRSFTVIHRERFRRRWRLLKNWMRIGNFLRPKINFIFTFRESLSCFAFTSVSAGEHLGSLIYYAFTILHIFAENREHEVSKSGSGKIRRMLFQTNIAITIDWGTFDFLLLFVDTIWYN